MNPLLDNISSELADRLHDAGHAQVFSQGSQIFARDDEPHFLPIVVSGAVKMVRFPEPGKEVIIGIFRAGEMFAVPPVFDGEPYPATAIAMEDSTVLKVGRNDFLQLLRESPEFAFEVIAWTCDMLREKTSMIRTLATASPEIRVARVLIKLAENGGSVMPLRIPVRRQDIAEMASLTTETTIRVVRRLADEGVLRIAHGKIYIDELSELQRLARQ